MCVMVWSRDKVPIFWISLVLSLLMHCSFGVYGNVSGNHSDHLKMM